MIKEFVVLLLISFSNSLFGQDVITNIITEAHENVAGTKISLIPPKGFTKASNFSGFQQNESGSSIAIVEMPTSFSKLKNAFTKEALLTTGIELDETKELNINGISAILMTGIQSTNGTLFSKVMMAIGTDDEVAIITCAYPNDLQEIGKEITASVLSIIYETELVVDPFEGIDFTVNSDSTELAFAKSISGSYIYTHDGKFPTESESKANLIIVKSHSEISVEDRKLFAINRLKQTPFYLKESYSTIAVSIDDISGYEVFAKGVSKTSGIEYELYQVILFSDDQFYVFFGSTSWGDKKTLNEMKRIVESFELK